MRIGVDATAMSSSEGATDIRSTWRNPLIMRIMMNRGVRIGIHPVLVMKVMNLIIRRLPKYLCRWDNRRIYESATLFSESVVGRIHEQ